MSAAWLALHPLAPSQAAHDRATRSLIRQPVFLDEASCLRTDRDAYKYCEFLCSFISLASNSSIKANVLDFQGRERWVSPGLPAMQARSQTIPGSIVLCPGICQLSQPCFRRGWWSRLSSVPWESQRKRGCCDGSVGRVRRRCRVLHGRLGGGHASHVELALGGSQGRRKQSSGREWGLCPGASLHGVPRHRAEVPAGTLPEGVPVGAEPVSGRSQLRSAARFMARYGCRPAAVPARAYPERLSLGFDVAFRGEPNE